jgi:hypothetical protein
MAEGLAVGNRGHNQRWIVSGKESSASSLLSKACGLFVCFSSIVLDGNAKDGKSTKRTESKIEMRIKLLILLIRIALFHCWKRWW